MKRSRYWRCTLRKHSGDLEMNPDRANSTIAFAPAGNKTFQFSSDYAA